MSNLELKATYMAKRDYRTLVTRKKCYEPENITWEVKFCQGECGQMGCDNNFVILTLGSTGTEIGRYQFRCNENQEFLGMKRLYAQLFKPIEFRGVKKLNV